MNMLYPCPTCVTPTTSLSQATARVAVGVAKVYCERMSAPDEGTSAEGGEDNDATMEEEGEEEVLPEVSLDIFDDIKSSHAQHGLRHGDYVRYRQYCSRRLHRVRTAVGFLHGKGRYVKKVLEPRMVRESRHLLIPLYCAERAWAYAMALKRDNSGGDPQPRLRFRLLHRLSKAAKWATALAKLCAVRGDQRTALEAQAYAGFMVGNMHLEREEWGKALTHLRRTKTICTELSRVSLADQASSRGSAPACPARSLPLQACWLEL